MAAVKYQICFPTGYIKLEVGGFIAADHSRKVQKAIRDLNLPLIPYKIQGKEITSIDIDDMETGEGNATI